MREVESENDFVWVEMHVELQGMANNPMYVSTFMTELEGKCQLVEKRSSY